MRGEVENFPPRLRVPRPTERARTGPSSRRPDLGWVHGHRCTTEYPCRPTLPTGVRVGPSSVYHLKVLRGLTELGCPPSDSRNVGRCFGTYTKT